jgi:hypothetical protein
MKLNYSRATLLSLLMAATPAVLGSCVRREDVTIPKYITGISSEIKGVQAFQFAWSSDESQDPEYCIVPLPIFEDEFKGQKSGDRGKAYGYGACRGQFDFVSADPQIQFQEKVSSLIRNIKEISDPDTKKTLLKFTFETGGFYACPVPEQETQVNQKKSSYK